MTALSARARAHELLHDDTAALADDRRALELSPQPDLYLAAGRILEARGALDDAAALYEEAMISLQGAVVIRERLIAVERRRGRPAHALALVEQLLPTLPRKGDWGLLRADLLDELGRPRAARVQRQHTLEELDQTLKVRVNAQVLQTRARCLVALGRSQEARRDVDDANRLGRLP